jgi:hypothetical protein
MPYRTHRLKSGGWETIETYVGVGTSPGRHIRVSEHEFRLRKKIAIFGGGGKATPACVEYGGTGWHVIQVKGQPGQTVTFFQGAGKCSA